MTVSPLVRHPGPGCVVEYMLSNQPVLAYVLSASGDKLRLWTVAKREVPLPANRLLPWSGPQEHEGLAKADIDALLQACQARRQAVEAQVDALELWDMAQGEVGLARAEWFAQLLWTAPDIDQIAAMGRSLLAHKTHFKFLPPEFEILPRDKVEVKLEEARRARMREKLAGEGREFLRRVWDKGGAQAGPEPDAETLEKLQEIIFARMADPANAEVEAVWKELVRGLPEHPHLAVVLAERWGLVPPHYNYLLDQAGYRAGNDWAAPFAQDVESLVTTVQAGLGEAEPSPFVSIDAATTRDIDDAFVVDRCADGGFRAVIALACPVREWDFASPLAAAVADRATSLYLPEGASHMLPERLGTDAYSLVAGQPRPALVVDCRVDGQGRLCQREIHAATVRVAANRTYEAAEAAIQSGAEAMLTAGHQLAELLRARRVADGAVVIERPDPEITLSQRQGETWVDIVLKDSAPSAWLLVSELMILACEAAAGWALEQELPFLYRTQDLALPREFAGIWTAPADVARIVRHFGPTITELDPRPHRGLGVAAYTSITSPLRRYVDFLNCAQVHSLLTTGRPCFGRQELAGLLPRLAARTEAVGQVQRYRPRYWKLQYLRQWPGRFWPAVAVDDAGGFVSLALPELQIFVRVPRTMVGEKIVPGQPYCLRFSRIDPLTNELRVGEVAEPEVLGVDSQCQATPEEGEKG